MNMKNILLFIMLLIGTIIYSGALLTNHSKNEFKNTHFDSVNDTDSLIADETYITNPNEDNQHRIFIITYNDITRIEYANKLDWIIVDEFYSEEDSCKVTWYQYSDHTKQFEERTTNLK